MKELSAVVLVAAMLFALPGMARQDAAPPAPAEAPKQQESRTGWLRRVYATDRCTFEDGCRALLNLSRGEHVEGTFDEILAKLSDAAAEGGAIVDASWGLAATDKLTKGTLGYMLCKALKIQGGVTMRLVGISRRYALRECIYIGLINQGTTDEYVSGRELLDIINKADVYKAEGSLKSLRKP